MPLPATTHDFANEVSMNVRDTYSWHSSSRSGGTRVPQCVNVGAHSRNTDGTMVTLVTVSPSPHDQEHFSDADVDALNCVRIEIRCFRLLFSKPFDSWDRYTRAVRSFRMFLT